MTNSLKQLRRELHSAGASPAEVRDLVPLAARLAALGTGSSPSATTSSRWAKVVQLVAFSLTGLAAGMALVVISQSVLPGNVLYPIQKASDSIATSLHPSYRASVMMKRAQQVHELVVRHADTQHVLATLADYTRQAGAYKAAPHADYAAFEFCKTNLQQAAAMASPEVRRAIDNSLESLGAV